MPPREVKQTLDGVIGQYIIGIHKHRPLPSGHTNSRIASRRYACMADGSGTYRNRWELPVFHNRTVEFRIAIEYDDRLHQKTIPPLLGEAFHAVTKHRQWRSIYRYDDADKIRHGYLNSRVMISGLYLKEIGDSMDSGKLPIATNAISTS